MSSKVLSFKSSKNLNEVVQDSHLSVTEKQSRMLDLSAKTQEISAKDANSLVFLAKPFIQTTLPHRDPGDIRVWVRKNGKLTLSIKPGYEENTATGKHESIGIPYGSIPRLLLIWMNTEALRTGRKTLELGHNLSEFMRQLGLDPTQGGKRGDIARLKDQMTRMFRSLISLDEVLQTEKGASKRWIDMQVVSLGCMSWFNTRDYRFNADPKSLQEEIDGSWIQLTDLFHESITSSTIPLDMRIIQELKQSPLALDIYAWMVHRTFGTYETISKKPSFVTWQQLHDQFGTNYGDINNFKKKAKKILNTIQVISNNLSIEDVSGGIRIFKKLIRLK